MIRASAVLADTETRPSHEHAHLARPSPTAGAFATRRRSPEQWLWSGGGIVAIVLLWQAGVSFGGVSQRYTSSPFAIAATAARLIADGALLHDALVTLAEYAIGMAAAILVGIPTGLAAGWYRRFRYAVEPYLVALYATPSLALLPLLVLWFGIGIRSTTVLVVISAFFPIVLNVMQGVQTVDVGLLRMARSFGAGQGRVFRDSVLPATVPFLASGLQLGVARGLIGVVVGEMYAASSGGLGYMIAVAGSTLAIDQMFVAVAAVTLIGMLLLGATRTLEQRLLHWKPRANE
jgi:NitT/TauT family transport system permease protein